MPKEIKIEKVKPFGSLRISTGEYPYKQSIELTEEQVRELYKVIKETLNIK